MPLPICHEPIYKAQLEKFLSDWPLARVRTMPLTDYTRVDNDSGEEYKGSFCYALEQLTPVGIGGGNALKFSIYAFQNPSKMPRAKQDSRYAWEGALGDTAEEAFAKVRAMVIDTIIAAQEANYAAIDDIRMANLVKWKIAFLYQNPAKPGVVGCVSERGIKGYFQDLGISVGTKTMSQLYALALSKVTDQPSVQKTGGYIWDVYVAKHNDETPPAEIRQSTTEEPTSGYSAKERPPADLVNLTSKPHAYHWLYSLLSGENLFPDRRLSRDIVMDYLPDTNYSGLEIAKAQSKEGMAYLFGQVMQPGDIVYAYNDGLKMIEGVGIITGAYEYKPEADDGWKHRRTVYWVPDSQCPWPGAQFSLKPVTAMLNDMKWDWRGVISETLVNARLKPPGYLPKVAWNPLSHPEPCAGEFSPKWTSRPSAEEDPDNKRIKPSMRILYGPPGTGKTFRTSEEVFVICMGDEVSKRDYTPAATELKLRGNVEFVTFHQNYDYSDFIEGYRPTIDEKGSVSYRLEDGVLKRIAKRAIRYPKQPFVLVIDEINRGNISKIFGELITLIEADKRIGEKNATPVTLPYSGEIFCLPPNLSIIGTMNTADRSIAVLDTALRRRFEFRRMDPDTKALDDNSPGCGKMLKELNKRLRDLGLTNEQQIGHAWFWDLAKNTKEGKPAGLDKEALEKVFLNKILPLLEEWFFGEEEKLAKLVASFCTGYPGQLEYLKGNEWVAIATKGKSAE